MLVCMPRYSGRGLQRGARRCAPAGAHGAPRCGAPAQPHHRGAAVPFALGCTVSHRWRGHTPRYGGCLWQRVRRSRIGGGSVFRTGRPRRSLVFASRTPHWCHTVPQSPAGERVASLWARWSLRDGERRAFTVARDAVPDCIGGGRIAPRRGATVAQRKVTVRATVAEGPPPGPLFAVWLVRLGFRFFCEAVGGWYKCCYTRDQGY